jgi:hypothetical protein
MTRLGDWLAIASMPMGDTKVLFSESQNTLPGGDEQGDCLPIHEYVLILTRSESLIVINVFPGSQCNEK